VSFDPAPRGGGGPSWSPHPDDEADVRDAIAGAERGELLSPAATESFLRWLDGSGDQAWLDELD
jgi:hypothetical protein